MSEMVVSGAPYHAPLLAQSHARQRAVYACIVRYKREHDGNSPTVLDACAAERHALRATLDAVRSALDTHAPKDTDKEADHED